MSLLQMGTLQTRNAAYSSENHSDKYKLPLVKKLPLQF